MQVLAPAAPRLRATAALFGFLLSWGLAAEHASCLGRHRHAPDAGAVVCPETHEVETCALCQRAREEVAPAVEAPALLGPALCAHVAPAPPAPVYAAEPPRPSAPRAPPA
jgi:hypothetical protein